VDHDLELLERFKDGDGTAFDELLIKYQRPVLNLIIRFMGSTEQAEDLAQEVFLRVFRAAVRFEARAKFFTYLYRITLNLCLKEREKAAKQKTESLDDGDERNSRREIADPRGSVEDTYASMELSQMVQEAVKSLPDEQRSVVILARYHDMSYEEIAETLDISVPAVKSRLHRAKLALKDRLAPCLMSRAVQKRK
jgi:RNA polymerase sigma-70 factor (ECF subfamily)